MADNCYVVRPLPTDNPPRTPFRRAARSHCNNLRGPSAFLRSSRRFSPSPFFSSPPSTPLSVRAPCLFADLLAGRKFHISPLPIIVHSISRIVDILFRIRDKDPRQGDYISYRKIYPRRENSTKDNYQNLGNSKICWYIYIKCSIF